METKTDKAMTDASERAEIIADLRRYWPHQVEISAAATLLEEDAGLKDRLFEMQNAAIDLTKQLAEQSAELEAVRKDAERFRFLLSECERGSSSYNIFPYDWDQCRNSRDVWTIRGPEYDKRSFVEALDADMALAAQPGAKGERE